jgi:uncharacterized membrane protein
VKEFLKTTIVGGVLFLLPVALVLMVLNHAFELAAKVVRPVSQSLHFEHTIGGIGSASALTILLLVTLSFAAGIIARTEHGRRISGWFERSFLGGLPQYQAVKSMGEGLAQLDDSGNFAPVLVSFDGGWQIGYILEPLENGWLAVFVPQAPSLVSGSLLYVPASRVRPLNIPMAKAKSVLKHMGSGSREILGGIDLTRSTERQPN